MSRAPNLTRKLVLEEAQRSPDSAGGWTETWVELGTLWAEVKAGSGRERGLGAAQRSQVSYKITVRAAPDAAPSRPVPQQRFRDGARRYEILAVADDHPSRAFLTCHCREEVLS